MTFFSFLSCTEALGKLTFEDNPKYRSKINKYLDKYIFDDVRNSFYGIKTQIFSLILRHDGGYLLVNRYFEAYPEAIRKVKPFHLFKRAPSDKMAAFEQLVSMTGNQIQLLREIVMNNIVLMKHITWHDMYDPVNVYYGSSSCQIFPVKALSRYDDSIDLLLMAITVKPELFVNFNSKLLTERIQVQTDYGIRLIPSMLWYLARSKKGVDFLTVLMM